MHRRLDRHNAWANALLDEETKGTSGSIGRTLKHLVAVEVAYPAMLQGAARLCT